MMEFSVRGGGFKRKIWLVAITLSILFLIQLIYNGLRLGLISDPDPVLLAADALTPAVVLTTSDEISSQDLLERPVFWNTRRIIQNVEKAPSSSAITRGAPNYSNLEKISLLGVYGSGESEGIIVLLEGKTRRGAINSKLKGWEITEINGREVTFRQKGVSKTVAFEYETAWSVPVVDSPPIPRAEDLLPEELEDPASGGVAIGGY